MFYAMIYRVRNLTSIGDEVCLHHNFQEKLHCRRSDTTTSTIPSSPPPLFKLSFFNPCSIHISWNPIQTISAWCHIQLIQEIHTYSRNLNRLKFWILLLFVNWLLKINIRKVEYLYILEEIPQFFFYWSHKFFTKSKSLDKQGFHPSLPSTSKPLHSCSIIRALC